MQGRTETFIGRVSFAVQAERLASKVIVPALEVSAAVGVKAQLGPFELR